MTRQPLVPLEQRVYDTEGDWQRDLVALAYDLGWGISGAMDKRRDRELAEYEQPALPLDGLVFHPRVMYRSEPGWPDLTLVRRWDRRLIFAELKVDKPTSKLTPRQAKVLDLLRSLATDHIHGHGPRIEVYVWRPSQLASIRAVLA